MPLQWKHRVLSTGPPGKSLILLILTKNPPTSDCHLLYSLWLIWFSMNLYECLNKKDFLKILSWSGSNFKFQVSTNKNFRFSSIRWRKELTHWKRPWCWERLRAGIEGNNRGGDDWMASPTQWTWVEQAPGVGDGQGSLRCCSPWGHQESDWTDTLIRLFSLQTDEESQYCKIKKLKTSLFW